jgi:hypothetical protein
MKSARAYPNALRCHALAAEVRQLLTGALLNLNGGAVCRVDINSCQRRRYEEGYSATMRKLCDEFVRTQQRL